MSNKIYKKSPKLYLQWDGINPYSNLTRKKSYRLETKCLKSLEKNYICTCGHGVKNPHFPRVISEDKKTLIMSMSWAGETVSALRLKKVPINIPNMEAQIKCILSNLNRAGVYHLDMHKSGKNLCIQQDTLSLIDFDIARIKKGNKIRPETPMLISKLEHYQNPTYDEYFHNLVHNILTGMINNH